MSIELRCRICNRILAFAIDGTVLADGRAVHAAHVEIFCRHCRTRSRFDLALKNPLDTPSKTVDDTR